MNTTYVKDGHEIDVAWACGDLLILFDIVSQKAFKKHENELLINNLGAVAHPVEAEDVNFSLGVIILANKMAESILESGDMASVIALTQELYNKHNTYILDILEAGVEDNTPLADLLLVQANFVPVPEV